MCGIAGVVALGSAPVQGCWSERMLPALRHRGPDGQGTYVDPRVMLCHTLLALRGAQQPLCFAEAGLLLVANGEIYNHTVEFAQTPEEYRQWGADFAGRLEGMFALALWDQQRGQLILARDRSGMKPLYYWHDHEFLVFASELTALLTHPQVPRRICLPALDQYCRFGCVLEPDTLVEGVQQLPPGHSLRVGPGVFSLQPFPEEELASEDLFQTLRRSVETTLQSQHPLGVFLSGGLDSSAVAALTRQLTGAVTTFSITFAEADWDEGPFSQLVADHLQADHHPLKMTAGLALEAALALQEGLDQPLADCSALACWALARHARGFVKGVLTGDGGDEVFAGYPWHKVQPPFDGDYAPWIEAAPAMRLFSAPQRERLYRFPSSAMNPFAKLKLRLEHLPGWLAALRVDRATCLLSDLLVKVDRTTMLNSLEARLPWLNPSLLRRVESSLGPDLLDKKLLKTTLGHLLPEAILHRPKKGFGVPLALWMWRPGPFRDLIYDTLSSSQARLGDYFDLNFLRQLLRENERLPHHATPLWGLFLLESWLRRSGVG